MFFFNIYIHHKNTKKVHDDFSEYIDVGVGNGDTVENPLEVPAIVDDQHVVPDENSDEVDVIPVETDVPQVVEEPRFPVRDRQRPQRLNDYVCSNVDFCCMLSNYRVPTTYADAMDSPESTLWKEAMDDEMNSLVENETYDIVTLPENKRLVGGHWIYVIKDGPNDQQIFK